MPSLVTSVVGGLQARSAAGNAAKKMQAGYKQAGETVTGAVEQVNPEILEAARQAGVDVTGAAQTAGAGATSAAENLNNLLQPYMAGGTQAMEQLTSGMAPGGSLSQPFTASMMAQYSPAYQFQLAQGQQAAQRAAAAAGVSGSGGTARSLNRYAQQYAGTAFGNAADIYGRQQQQQFGQLATLAGAGMNAAATGGQAGMRAAEYAGNLGTGAAQWAGGANINARNMASQNTLGGANYLANTQVEQQKALAQGDLGKAAAWNQMLGGIGAAGDTLLFGGLGAGLPGQDAWSFGNIGKNIWGGGNPAAGTALMGGGGGGNMWNWGTPQPKNVTNPAKVYDWYGEYVP